MDSERFLEANAIYKQIDHYQFIIERIEYGQHVFQLTENFSREINADLVNCILMEADKKVLKIFREAVAVLKDKFDKL